MTLLNDIEAQAMTTCIKHHFSHNYIDTAIEEKNLLELQVKITKLYALPTSKFSVCTWTDFDNLCAEHKIRPV